MQRIMQTSLDSLIMQLEGYKLESEIILVDYNPPPDKPLLKDALTWPAQTKYCTIRTIIVPFEFHKRNKDWEKVPMSPPLAQNIGVSRSRGQFVLTTPIDILFPNEVVEFIAHRKLEEDKFYRTDRIDLKDGVLEKSTLEERLAFCRRNGAWVSTRFGIVPFLKHKKSLRSRTLRFSGKHPKKGDIMRLHFNGGDLTLMSREAWFGLRGWSEVTTWGNADEVFLYAGAYLRGLKEEMLPEPCYVYHIFHESRWKVTDVPGVLTKVFFYCFPAGIAIKLNVVKWKIRGILRSVLLGEKTKLDKLGVEYFSRDELKEILMKMLRGEEVKVRNDSDWGLGDEDLKEHFICRAWWENQEERDAKRVCACSGI